MLFYSRKRAYSFYYETANQAREPLLLCVSIAAAGGFKKLQLGQDQRVRRTNTHATCSLAYLLACLLATVVTATQDKLIFITLVRNPISVMQFDDTLIIVAGDGRSTVCCLMFANDGRSLSRTHRVDNPLLKKYQIRNR